MKKLQILLLVIGILFGYDSFSQTTRIPLTEKSLVKDSHGVVYAYEKWFPMLKTGDYKLEKNKDGNDEYVIVERERLGDKENKEIYGSNSGNFIDKKIKFPYMTDLDGKDYWNDSLKDKIVVLNFWFVKCPPCKAEIPELNKVYWRYRENENIVFLAVCLDNRETIAAFMKTNPFVFKLIPTGIEIAKQFNIAAYPTNLIIDKGVVKFGKPGYSTQNIESLEKTLKGLLAAQ